MNGIKLIWLMVIGAVALTLAACDSSSSGSGSPDVEDGTECVVPDDDDGGGGLMGLSSEAYELGADDILLRIDATGDEKWVAEDNNGDAQFWGSAEVLPSGFIAMEITNSKVSDPPKGTELIAFEVTEGVIFLMGTESFDESDLHFSDEDTVGINLDGDCPSNGTATHNFLNSPDSDTGADAVTYGVATVNTVSGVTDIDIGELGLDEDFDDGTAAMADVLTGADCDSGYGESAGGDSLAYLGAGFTIVFPENGSGSVVFPQPTGTPLDETDVAANNKVYRGVVQSNDGDGTPNIVAIGAEGQGGNTLYAAPYESVADIESDTLDLMGANMAQINLGQATANEDHFFDTSTITVGDFIRTMVMEMPDGRILIAGLIWDDSGATDDVAEADDDVELVLLVEQD